MIGAVTNDAAGGIVTTLEEGQRHGLEDGAWVTFSEVSHLRRGCRSVLCHPTALLPPLDRLSA